MSEYLDIDNIPASTVARISEALDHCDDLGCSICDTYPCSCDPQLDEGYVLPDAASAFDKQEGGDHYKKLGEFQPWKVLNAWLNHEELRGFAKGTAIVYLARERDKGGLGDIKKAVHTLQIYLELIEGGGSGEELV